MTISIRTRLTLWYALVVVTVLTVAGAAAVWTHGRLGLARLDADLQRAVDAALESIRTDISDEGLDLLTASRDACEDLTLPGWTIAISEPDGRVVAGKAGDLDPGALGRYVAGPSPRTANTDAGSARILAAEGGPDHQRYMVRIAAPLSPLDRERSMLLATLLVGLGLALTVAGLGGWLIGRLALRPLARMATEATAITGLTPEARLTVINRGDELGQLGLAFNALLVRLATVLTTQRQFMADASHELRTPVSVARTTAQVTLSRNNRSPEEYREALSTIAEQLERLTRMVGDMFLLARADASARPLQLADVYVDDIIDECVRAAAVLGRPRDVNIVGRGNEAIMVCGDASLLSQMLTNLLENAVRHTPSGGDVRVCLGQDSTIVELSVTDSGPGVPVAERERIFERFVRLAPANAQGGAGLGLPIARWIAEAHGGTLRYEPAPDQASRFVVRLQSARP